MSRLSNVTISKDGIVKLDLTKKSVRDKVQEVAKRFAFIPTTGDKNMNLELPKTITTKLYIVQCPSSGWTGVTTYSMEDLGYITLDTQEVTLDVPQDVDMEVLKAELAVKMKEKLKRGYEVALEKLG